MTFLANLLLHSVAADARPFKAKLDGLVDTGAAVIGERLGVPVGESVGAVGELEGDLDGLDVGREVGDKLGEFVGLDVGDSLGIRVIPQSLISNSLFSALSMII